jgi:predicted ATPase
MLRSVEIKHYGCIQSAEFKLTPLHALVGPNDSGKSTILRALHGWAAQVSDTATMNLYGRVGASIKGEPDMPGWPEGVAPRVYLDEHGATQFEYATANRGRLLLEESTVVLPPLGTATMVRLDPDELRKPCSLVTAATAARFPAHRGEELAGVYDTILGRGDETFARINKAVRSLFPTVANIRLETVNSSQKVLGLRLQDGTEIRAEQMSEGLLYYLAFAAIDEVSDARLLLVEEPENGLHPARIAEVVGLLRSISERGTQVIMATHSPLVVNALRPDEVSVVTRDAVTGTRVTPIAATPHFEDRARVYELGELWLSYCNGDDEAPLLQGKTQAQPEPSP